MAEEDEVALEEVEEGMEGEGDLEGLEAVLAGLEGEEGAEEGDVADELAALGEEMAGEGRDTGDDAADLDAAAEDSAAASPLPDLEGEAEEELPDDDEEQVDEHLRDAVEGSLRLKRMLSEDDAGAGGAPKKRRTGDEQDPALAAKIRQLLMRWQSTQDLTMKYVLDQCSMEEVTYLINSNYVPDWMNPRQQAPELLARHLVQQKEKRLGGGSRMDMISTFKLRWGLAMDAEKQLRTLPHRALRHVLDHFEGTGTLEDAIEEANAQNDDDFDDETAQNACPLRPGLKVMSRFNRLELIDPLADCAVFGDANLTFCLNLARHRKQLGHVGRVIATTFEELETLQERYKEIDQSITILEEHHAEVYHGVDCTRVALDKRFEGMEGKLGAVYYNFPHSGAIQGFFDSNPMVNWRHENLMRLFFRALRSFVKPGGIVKVASNSGAVGVRYSYIVGGAIENEFLHVETMPFLEWHLHRYGRSYGDRRDVTKRPDAKNNQSYNAQNANADMVYCFAYAPSGNQLPKQEIKLPPNMKTLASCPDGPFKHWQPGHPSRMRVAKQLHDRFVLEISGTHVG